jgi:hypothetical protein
MMIREWIYRAIYKLKIVLLRRRDPFVFKEANHLVGYRCYGGEIERLLPLAESANTPFSSGLLQSPGFVQVAGLVFDLRLDGVYRFYQLPSLSEQRLVCTAGLKSILQSFGYLLGYGDEDDKFSENTLIKELTSRRVVGSCGTLSLLTHKVLTKVHVLSRVVVLMTLDSWGGMDDGHTLLEIADCDNNWFLYDPSFGVCFKKDGRRLSLIEYSKLRNERIELERLPVSPGYSKFTNRSYDYDFWIGERFLSATYLLEWYRRVGELPLVGENGRLYCPRSSVKSGSELRILSRYVILSDYDFHKKFY